MITLLLMLSVALPTTLSAQKLGIRLDGGVQYGVGGGLQGATTNSPAFIQPLVGAGVYYHVIPKLRAGLDYSYTRMVREMLSSSMQTLPDGSTQGEPYRDLRMHFHGVGVTGEYNLLPAGPLALYAGAGAGCLITAENVYTIAISNTVKPGGTGNTIRVTGHNEPQHYVCPYFPVTLSLEFGFLPQVSLSLSAGYRFVVAGKHEFAPKGQAIAQFGLRFNLVK